MPILPGKEEQCLKKFCYLERMLDRIPGQLVKLLPKKAARLNTITWLKSQNIWTPCWNTQKGLVRFRL